MSDPRAYRFKHEVFERTYDLRPGSQAAADVRASLLRELGDIRLSIPRQDVLDLETLIDRRTGFGCAGVNGSRP